jgi:hypothetical protein
MAVTLPGTLGQAGFAARLGPAWMHRDLAVSDLPRGRWRPRGTCIGGRSQCPVGSGATSEVDYERWDGSLSDVERDRLLNLLRMPRMCFLTSSATFAERRGKPEGGLEDFIDLEMSQI